MSKPVLGIVLGFCLGLLDGLSSLAYGPEVRAQIVGIVIGSSFKGVVAGIIIGLFSRRFKSLPLGIIVGLAVGCLLALPIALATNPVTGEVYFWEIMLPGGLVGLIVGYATQQYGASRVANSGNTSH